MKNNKSYLKLGSYFLLLIFAVAGFNACSDDNEPDFAAPSIVISGSNTALIKPGSAISVGLAITSEGQVESIQVFLNDGFLEEVPLTDGDITSYTYTRDNVGATAEEGDELKFSFEVVNTQEARSERVDYTVGIAVFDEIVVKGQSLYQVTFDASGVVASGTTLKMSANRSYYIAQPVADVNIQMDSGTEWIVEEGVTVYVQSGVDLEIVSNGTVDMQGTANNPIVFTSENEIDGTAEAGDWKEFQLEGPGPGTNSGTMRYIRFEYLGDRAFILDNLGVATTISHIQVYAATDEALFLGGDNELNLSHFVITNSLDTGIRTDDDYRGYCQYFIIEGKVPGDGDESMYLRGDSRATFTNVTIVGPGASYASEGEPDGIRFWSTNGNKVYNAIVTGVPSWATRAEMNETDGRPMPTDINGPVVFAHSRVYGNESNFDDDSEVFFTDAGFNNSTVAVAGVDSSSFVPTAAVASDFNPNSINSFFQSAAFVGAIQDASNDWTLGWVRNADGSLRQ